MLLTLLLACGDKDDSALPSDTTDTTDIADTQDTQDTQDDGPPQVIEVFPADGSAGHTPSEHVSFVFQKVVDPATVSAHLDLSGFVACDVRWNDDNTGFSLVPKTPLELLLIDSAEDETRQEYTVTLGADVADLDGNTLGAPVSTTFTMARELSVRTATQSELTGSVSSTGQFGDGLQVGDDGSETTWATLITWDLSGIPSEASGLSSASLSLSTKLLAGDPWGDLGPLRIERVSIDGKSGTHAASALGSQEGPSGEGTDVVSVTGLLADEVGESDGRGQLRFRFTDASDGTGDRDLIQIEDETALKLIVYVP